MDPDQDQADPSPPVLSYSDGSGRIWSRPPRWAWVLAVIYLLLLAPLAALPMMLALGRAEATITVVSAVLVAAFLMSGFVLAIVPVQIARARPVKRTPFWMALLTGSCLGGLLVAAAAFGVAEMVVGELPNTLWWVPVVFPCAWAFWFVVFCMMRRPRPFAPADRLHRYLFGGSIAELLVAVPTHIIVRNRTYCCAGFATGTAIVTGVMVMLLAFGPGIAVLFFRRWKDRTTHAGDVTPRQDGR